MFSRRQALKTALSGLVAASGTSAIAASGAGFDRPAIFGAAVRPGLIDTDADYSHALRTYCAAIVPEGGLLWNDLRPDQATFDFKAADDIASFAHSYDLVLRGHTLVWHGVMPAWTETLTAAARAEGELVRHIDTVAGRYRSRMDSWIVVNEPLTEDAATLTDLRPTIWQRTIGFDHLAMAFQAARAADPLATLFINEYDIEYVGASFRQKREAYTALIRSLVDRNVPIDGVGIQGHLRSNLEIDWRGLQQFASDMHSLGLKLAVTELDVIDDLLPADIVERDRRVSQFAHAFLSSLSEVEQLDSILTWGITDKYTWVPTYYRRKDGASNRPLPLSASYEAKPLMKVLAQFSKIPGY
jgi:endo-1,4-beta-xylanase